MVIPLGLLGQYWSKVPTFIGNSAGNDNSGGITTTLAMTLPTRAVGDLLIAFVGHGGSASAPTISVSAGWTLFGTPISTANRGQAMAWRIATNNASDALTWTASVSSFMTAAMAVFRNNHASAAPEGPTAVASLNPPAVTPSWGMLWNIFLAFAAFNSTGTFTSYPTNYTGIVQFTPATTSASIPAIAMSYRIALLSTDDASTFSVGSGGNQCCNSGVGRPAP